MTADQFWNIIETTRAEPSMDARAAALGAELLKLSSEEVVGFEKCFGEMQDRAYTWNLWGAAYIIGGGCSDDAFMDFRSWLISRGREIFDRAVSDPDSLAELDLGSNAPEDAFFEEFAYVAAEVYEEKTGEDMPYVDRPTPADPAGEPWREDADDLARRFPRLWAKYGEN